MTMTLGLGLWGWISGPHHTALCHPQGGPTYRAQDQRKLLVWSVVMLTWGSPHSLSKTCSPFLGWLKLERFLQRPRKAWQWAGAAVEGGGRQRRSPWSEGVSSTDRKIWDKRAKRTPQMSPQHWVCGFGVGSGCIFVSFLFKHTPWGILVYNQWWTTPGQRWPGLVQHQNPLESFEKKTKKHLAWALLSKN